MSKQCICLILATLAVVGCTPTPTPSSTATQISPVIPTQLPQPTDLPDIEPTDTSPSDEIHPPHDLRIRISTTSDWTAVKFVEGTIVDDYEILSSSPESTESGFDQDRFFLIQPVLVCARPWRLPLDTVTSDALLVSESGAFRRSASWLLMGLQSWMPPARWCTCPLVQWIGDHPIPGAW